MYIDSVRTGGDPPASPFAYNLASHPGLKLPVEYRLELFLHEEDAVIEQRVSLCPHPVVLICNTVCVNFADPAYNVKYGEWFRVTDRRVYIFEPDVADTIDAALLGC